MIILTKLYEEGFNPFIASMIPQTVKADTIHTPGIGSLTSAMNSFWANKRSYFDVQVTTPFSKLKNKRFFMNSVDDLNKVTFKHFDSLLKANISDYVRITTQINYERSQVLKDDFKFFIFLSIKLKDKFIGFNVLFGRGEYLIYNDEVLSSYSDFDKRFIETVRNY
jgi:hypothetical protein